jgi:predicted O-linked N-acetylglucosamine transferase (SPINDLY family)/cytochrome c-type biogenesis protein CcmH/NrfG
VGTAEERWGPLAAILDEALKAYQTDPGSSSAWLNFLQARRSAASALAGMAPPKASPTLKAAALSVVRNLSKGGAHDPPVTAQDLALADDFARRGPMGLVAAMMLVPAWQWPAAPAAEAVPGDVVVGYVTWLFSVPEGFCALGQAGQHAAHVLRRSEELLQWHRSDPNAPAVRTALTVYRKVANCIPLYFADGALRRHFWVRGRLLTAAAAVGPQPRLPAASRAGRRLRVGFINRHFGPQTETYTTLPMFEALDPERFEVLLFSCRSGPSAVEAYARGHCAQSLLLPDGVAARLAALRAANLDVAVFGTNVTAVYNEVVELALHRVAPLQAVNNSSCVTTGLPEIDLYVSGALTESPDAAEHFTERLGLLPGPTHAFNYETDRQPATAPWTREALGLPAEAVVFVTAANYFKIIPEMREAWARLLAAVPGSRLLIHPFNPNWASEYPVKRFCAEFDRVLEQAGVSPDRLIVSTARFPSRTDVKELLAVGDIYLDTYPFGGVNSLVDPLEAGIPVVAWQGGTFRSRMGAALLRSVGLDSLVAGDGRSYQEIAVALATDSERRAALRTRIRAAMAAGPVFLDPLAHSEATGDLLELAYDELLAVGRDAFRQRRAPLAVSRCADGDGPADRGEAQLAAGDGPGAEAAARRILAAEPGNPRGRRLWGRCLLARDRPDRAEPYLRAASRQLGHDAGLWLDLGRAGLRLRHLPESAAAAEACLRLEPGNVEAWLLVGDLAILAANPPLLSKALAQVERLAPDYPGLATLRRRAEGNALPLAIALAEAKAAVKAKDWPEVVRRASAAVAADPTCAEAHHLLGHGHRLSDAAGPALEAFHQAASLAPGQPTYWHDLGTALARAGQSAPALAAFENVLRLQPDRLESRLAATEVMLALRQTARAAEMAEAILREQPDHCLALLWLGHARKQQGRLTEALRLHRRAVGAPEPGPRRPAGARPRVVFVVQHGPMWTNLASVYAAFAADAAWETILVACPYLGTFGEGEADKSLAVLDFLQREGLPFIRWDQVKLEPGFADIVFLPKPHDHTRPPEWQAPQLLKLVPRLAYVPYALEIAGGEGHIQWDLSLQRLAWMIFARSARQKAQFEQGCLCGAAHLVITGHPKLDALRDLDRNRDPEFEALASGRKLVLWNAQYDVRPDGTAFGGGMSTFMRWKDFLPEEFARRPKLALVIRPHPIFWSILQARDIMTRAQIDEFFARCDAAGNIRLDRRASYLPAFAASSAMLSDASSFLLEYPATGKPLLYLHNPRGPGLTTEGEFVLRHCYTAETEAEISRFLDQVERGEDPKATARRVALPEFIHLPPAGAGAAIKREVERRWREEIRQNIFP